MVQLCIYYIYDPVKHATCVRYISVRQPLVGQYYNIIIAGFMKSTYMAEVQLEVNIYIAVDVHVCYIYII